MYDIKVHIRSMDMFLAELEGREEEVKVDDLDVLLTFLEDNINGVDEEAEE